MTALRQSEAFETDLVRLRRKYPHLDEDFQVLKIALETCMPRPEKIPGIVRISGLGQELQQLPFYKVRKFRSRDFPGKGNQSGFRFIFAYLPNPGEIVFVEAYHKNKQENEDRHRILDVARALQQ
ncbi:MAG: hypothetical protein M1143_02370 [Candidatus Thermoplasmatota archaeon]|nr:hypothetical protein [Candidatus Thermoplasmatota archaeon]